MCKLDKKLYMSILGGIVFLISSSTIVYAQNFAAVNNDSFDEQSIDDEDLSEEDIKFLLESEGIPLTPVVYEDDFTTESKYTLGENDVIDINVQRHSEVSGRYRINKEGKIQYGFVGDVEVAGLTKSEVDDLLTEILSKYIISPDLTVIISGYNSKVVYVIGEVGSPGKIFMRGDTITVRDALVQANLPLLSAKSAKSRLITPTDDGQPALKNVNVHKLLYEGDLRENLIMKPGDTLYIPPTVLAKTMRVIQPIAAPINSSAGTARTVTTGF